MNKGWLIVKKQEMTKIRVGEEFLPVTVVKIMPQEIVRFKSDESDGYVAVVVGVDKYEKDTKKWKVVSYKKMVEFKVDSDYVQNNQIGWLIDINSLEWVESVDVTWISKGKGFQWVMKRHNTAGLPATHGHKFTRTGWSKWSRKPRGTAKGHPHAGHMWAERITLKDIKILDSVQTDKEQLLVLKGSLPWAYNGLLRLSLR